MKASPAESGSHPHLLCKDRRSQSTVNNHRDRDTPRKDTFKTVLQNLWEITKELLVKTCPSYFVFNSKITGDLQIVTTDSMCV